MKHVVLNDETYKYLKALSKKHQQTLKGVVARLVYKEYKNEYKK